jgi:hypothetical protein
MEILFPYKILNDYINPMCWNETVSWITFGLGTLFNIIVAYYFQEPIITVICILWEWIILIQLFEAIAWRNQPTNPDSIPDNNRLAAIGIMIDTITQPIILALGLICFTEVPKINKILALIVVFIYICWAIYAVNEAPKVTHLTLTEGCNHLDYTWWGQYPLTCIPYLIALFLIIFLLLRPVDLAWFIAIYLIITLTVSSLIYKCGSSSLWCWFAVFAPIATGIYWYFTRIY